MVSTRQMATSNNNGGNSNSNAGSQNSTAEESARLSVVTRQTSSNYVLMNCSTIPPSANITSSRHQTHLQTHAVKTGSSSNSAIISSRNATTQKQLLDLPIEILFKIFSYDAYKRVGQLRMVSCQMNEVCMLLLNSTFSKLITETFNRFQAIKALMPRRESARRNHPLACECDIIETCYMRLSLLQMTFGKHIERGHCCFFPAAILDEVYTILRYIKNTPRLERPYRVTDELFDLSTMAMEYFKDRIEQTLPDIAYYNKDIYKLPTTTKRPALVIATDLSDSPSSLPSPPQSNMVLRKGIRKIKQGMKIYNNQLSVLRNELRTCKRKSAEQSKQISEQQKLLAEQRKQTLEYASRLDENDKKNEEMSRKFSTLLQELNKCKTELQYWRSKSPAIPTCTSCGHKVAPILPAEDYQALVNQGVKPEDILNLNDDTDAESDVSINDNNLALCGEFVYPDEATTAKLYAVNTATKILKRQHSTSTETTSNANTSNIHVHDAPISNGITGGPTQMTNSLDVVAKSAGVQQHIIRSNCVNGNNNNNNGGNKDLNLETNAMTADFGGIPTKSFYDTNAVYKGVIVTPLMLKSKKDITAAFAVGGNVTVGVGTIGGSSANAVENNISDAGNIAERCFTLLDITSHETKKARRVQKATRGLNGSGKRSK